MKKRKIKIIFAIIFLLLSFLFIFLSFNKSSAYSVAVRFANVDDSNIVLLDYKVYGTEERFELGLKEDVKEIIDRAKEDNEIILVRINGENKTKRKFNYILQGKEDFYELNIEYYIVKNIDILSYSLPCKTFISLIKTPLLIVNIVLSCVNFLLSSLFFILYMRKKKNN